MKTMTVFALSLLAVLTAPSARADKISAAKAAELTCHRLERLVALKKIPGTFLTHLASVQVDVVANGQPNDPAFRTVSSQVAGADGRARQLELFLDASGKALNFNLLDGADAVNAPVWPQKDALGLMETAMHYLVDNAERDAALEPFFRSLTLITLVPVTDEAGKLQARLDIRASAVATVLQLVLNADGGFVSAKVVESPLP